MGIVRHVMEDLQTESIILFLKHAQDEGLTEGCMCRFVSQTGV